MLDVVVVTTFPALYWNEGLSRAMLETLSAHWPAHVRKIAFVRDDLRATIGSVAGVEIMDLDDRSTTLMQFIRTFNAPIRPLITHGGRYEYKWDAASFAYKIAALDAVRRLIGPAYRGYVIWLDADVVTKQDVPMDELKLWCPPNVDVSCLVRAAYGPECGFVGYNWLGRGAKLLARLIDFYKPRADGTYPIFEQKEWHDSYLFGEALRSGRFRFLNLAAGTSSKHCWPETPLGPYMVHLKGPERKRLRADLPDSVVLKEPDRVKGPLQSAT